MKIKAKDRPKAHYSPGDKVTTFFEPDQILTIKEPVRWNGLTYMYSFEETDMRCGESYVSKYIHH